MFHLPKQVIRPNRKSPIKDFLNHTDEKKRPNINQIKEEIESILKRNNSPLCFKTNLETQKSQKYLNQQTLERQKSKNFLKNTDESVQMAKNNRKLYEEYLLCSDITLKKQKSITTIKEHLQTIVMKSTSYDNDACAELFTSKSNFNSHRTISHSEKGKKSKSVFHNEEHQPLGLGKLLFSTNNEVKFRRQNLLSGKRKSESKSIFKETANETFYQPAHLNFTKYLKSERKSSFDTDSKEIEVPSTKEKSFEIVKKEILFKQPFINEENSSKNFELPKISADKRTIEESKQENLINSEKNQSTQSEENIQLMNKTLNVVDDELLVYYGKLKNRKIINPVLNEVNKKPHINKIRPKEENPNSKEFNKYLNIGPRTSREFRKQNEIESSWKMHHLDPWEKIKMDEEDSVEEHLFNKLEDKSFSEELHLRNF